jgi:hypothetical protein
MALHEMLLQQKLLLGALILAATAASQPDSSCNDTCGNLTIPYPFGTSEGCYLDPSFLITCNYLSGIPTPFLGDNTSNIPVLDISLLDGELRVSSFVARDCYNESGLPVNRLKSTSHWIHWNISPSHIRGTSSLSLVATHLRILKVFFTICFTVQGYKNTRLDLMDTVAALTVWLTGLAQALAVPRLLSPKDYKILVLLLIATIITPQYAASTHVVLLF